MIIYRRILHGSLIVVILVIRFNHYYLLVHEYLSMALLDVNMDILPIILRKVP